MRLRLTKRNRAIIERVATAVVAVAIVGAGVPQPTKAVQADLFPSYLSSVTVGQASLAPQPRSLPDVPAKPQPVTRTVWVTVTAYSSTVDQTDSDPFTTASGEKVRPGIVAWNGVPFGTKLRLPDGFGDRIFVVQDRLNPRASGYVVDVWMPTREEALQWGVRVVKAEILL